jgi:hypothetical protein
MDRIENDASNNSIVQCVFIVAVTFFTEPLPSKVMGDTHTCTYTQTDVRDL